jgi:hypothetical protein
VITTRIAEMIIAWMTLPARYAHGGSGVPRVRFRIPASRLKLTLIAMFV